MGDSPPELDELPYLVGRAWKIGDRANDVDPTLVDRASAGDFLVAGVDFGVDAVATAMARAMKRIGFGAVIARSFGEEVFRAAIHIGLPVLQVEETEAVKTGDRLRVDIEGHKVVNLSSGDRYVIRNVYGDVLDILRAGGLAEYAALRRQ
jgi:3-isopropylmalate/(R)-2-methylmalate dehydratase small subunit